MENYVVISNISVIVGIILALIFYILTRVIIIEKGGKN